MARRSSSSLVAASALLLVLAAPTAQAATDCLGTLIAANTACTSEIAALRDGNAPASVGKACCAAAARVFSAGFGADCACAASVAPYRQLLDGARAALDGKCAGARIAELPACGGGIATAAAAVTPAGAVPDVGTGALCASQSTSCNTKCTPRNVANPSQAQIDTAKKCPNDSTGYCDFTTGTAVCGTGFSVPDPRNWGRQCFKCCTPRKAPTGSQRTGARSCPAPPRRGGGGGGGCFPGSSTVTLESGASVELRDLKIGEKVLSADPVTGRTSFETVYFFGHSLPQASSEFVRLEVAEVAAAESTTPTKALELTRKHLVPTLPGPVYKRAMDVVVGDVVLVADEKQTREAEVARVSFVAKSDGLFAPLTTGGGHVVVDGVLSSVHSNNMLDPLAEVLDRRDLLQWAYETFGASVLKAAYRVFGAEAMQKASPIVAGLGLGDAAQLAVGVRGLVLGQQQAVKTA